MAALDALLSPVLLVNLAIAWIVLEALFTCLAYRRRGQRARARR